MKKQDNVQIPKRNYIIFILLVILTVGLTFKIRSWYQLNQDLNKKNTIMSQFLSSVNEKEFDYYTLEHSNVIIYLASSKDETLEDFELDLKKSLIDYNLKDHTIFIDLKQVDNDFFDNFKEKYFADNVKNIEFGNFTNILIMENGKVNSILYNKKTSINIDDVMDFFYSRGVIGQA